jgi:hypothetical protein
VNGAAEPRRDLLKIDVFDGNESVRLKNRCNVSRFETAVRTFIMLRSSCNVTSCAVPSSSRTATPPQRGRISDGLRLLDDLLGSRRIMQP